MDLPGERLPVIRYPYQGRTERRARDWNVGQASCLLQSMAGAMLEASELVSHNSVSIPINKKGGFMKIGLAIVILVGVLSVPVSVHLARGATATPVRSPELPPTKRKSSRRSRRLVMAGIAMTPMPCACRWRMTSNGSTGEAKPCTPAKRLRTRTLNYFRAYTRTRIARIR